MTEGPNVHSCVVGMGYVGSTLAIHLDRAGYKTVGYDTDEQRVDELQSGHDTRGEFEDDVIAECDISFENSPEALGHCDYVFVTLPTPIDTSQTPDLSGLKAACETIGHYISDDTVIVFESTLYPGATREVLRPAIEQGTSTQGGTTFSVGYSPERVVPGGGNDFRDVTKVVSAENEHVLRDLADLYGDLVDAGVHLAESIETAEASKCLENVQRDVNIGLVNEFALGCDHLDIDLNPYAVLEAARTKWNFHDYRPGIVGGHCIPIDPHYLRYKFKQCGFDPRILSEARNINQQMVNHVCSITAEALHNANLGEQTVDSQDNSGEQVVRTVSRGAGSPRTEQSDSDERAQYQVLLLGFGYKSNTSDVRNSGVSEIADGFQRLGFEVQGYDPYYDAESVPESYDFEVLPRLDFDGTDAIVLLTPHDEVCSFDLEMISELMNDNPVLVDVGDAYDSEEAKERGFTYRRLGNVSR